MAVINHAKREINAKIVYFGPPGCGKGELFQFIHQRIKPSLCGPLKSMPAGQDSLLFFDYIPFETSSLDGYRIRFHLYTMTGPVTNPGTWKMTLKGVDGIALVTSGDTSGHDAVDSLRVLKSMLTGYGRDLRSLPRVWLPTDFSDAGDAESELMTCFDANRTVACSTTTGEGVLQGLAVLSQEVLQGLRDEYEPANEPPAVTPTPLAEPPDEVFVDSGRGVSLPSPEAVVLPELKVSLTGNTTVTIPLTVQHGDTVKRCHLRFSIQLEEESP